MTDFDVSLRLRLQNQLSKPAQDAERDLKELRTAAERLGQTKSISLAGNLEKVGKSATDARGKINSIGREADELRQKLSRVDNGAFDGLKADAHSAEQAINRVGQAATELKQKLNGLKGSGVAATGGPVRPGLPVAHGGSAGSAAGGLLDQLNMPLALGTGAAYVTGGIAGLGVVGAGATINAAAGDEQRSDFLRITGQYGAEEQKRIDDMLSRVGARRGIGTQAAQGVFGALQAGGLSSTDAAAMTDPAVVFSTATNSDSTDAANLTIALRNNMGITPDKMMSAYDSMAYGGKRGQFEIKDMTRYFPELAALMQGVGEKGASGVNLLTALLQSSRSTTGTSESAATNVKGMLGKFLSSDFRGKAEDIGLDPEKIMEGAKKRGDQPVLAMLDAIRGKVGTNPYRLKELMPDQESGAALSASIQNLDEIRLMMKEMSAAKGDIEKDYKIATDNLNAQKDRLSSNVGKTMKDAAKPTLPFLTRAASWASDRLEKAEDTRSARAERYAASGMPQTKQDIQKYLRGNLNSFLLGDAAKSDFNFREAMGINLRPTAQSSMQSYSDGLAEEGKKAETEALSIADRIRSALGFTVSPTISPVIAPTPAPVSGEKHSSLRQSNNIKLTQNITSPNPKLAAIRSHREQARAIRQAQARSLYDIGRMPA